MLSRVAERHHRPSTAPLRLLVREPEGLLQVHTASFRGSFASVFSEALRSAGLGSRVLSANSCAAVLIKVPTNLCRCVGV